MLRKEKQKMELKYFITKIKVQTKYAWDSGQRKRTKSGRGVGGSQYLRARRRGGWAHGASWGSHLPRSKRTKPDGLQQDQGTARKRLHGGGGWALPLRFLRTLPSPQKEQTGLHLVYTLFRQRCDTQTHTRAPHVSPAVLMHKLNGRSKVYIYTKVYFKETHSQFTCQQVTLLIHFTLHLGVAQGLAFRKGGGRPWMFPGPASPTGTSMVCLVLQTSQQSNK